MIPYLPLQTAISCLFLLTLFQSHAGWFADSMQFHSREESLWESRINHLNCIETNQHRNFDFHDDDLRLFEQAFSNQHLIDHLNAINQDTSLLDTLMSSPSRDLFTQLPTKLNQLLHALPSLEVESYRSEILPQALFNRLRTGVVYHKIGFMESYSGLHIAYDHLDQLTQIQTTGKKILIKIQGKHSRLVDHITQRFEGHILWPKDSYFKIMEMDYDAEQNLHFMLLKEIEKPTQARLRQNVAHSSNAAANSSCL